MHTVYIVGNNYQDLNRIAIDLFIYVIDICMVISINYTAMLVYMEHNGKNGDGAIFQLTLNLG